jgi:cysteine synthase
MSKNIIERLNRDGEVVKSATVENATSPDVAIATSGIALKSLTTYRVKTLTGRPGRPKTEHIAV